MRLMLAICLATVGVAGWAQDQKAPSPSTEQQVMALVNSAQNELNPQKRAEAVEVLARFDGHHFPEIAPVLIQVLERDSDPAVRKEAAKSLGKVRPATAEALDALNHAAEKDPVLKVRMAARVAKLGYRAPQAAPLPQAPAGNAPPTTASTLSGGTSVPVTTEARQKWTDKLTFWKKKPAAPVEEKPLPAVTKPQAPAPLPKTPKGENGPLLLPPPPSQNP